ncbi:kinetochore protein NDC8 [Gracilaria domingensis]|nr:kinetochore protein NDC8 [Gracilaria domingensis]
MLTSPSSKDFQTLFLFLVRRLDPTYNFIKRFEDEIPALLRGLGYPFSISKSALSAVGSPHTWPTLLGVLTWLVNMLKYSEAYIAAQASGSTMDPQARREKMFSENTELAYDQFLKGADTFPELDEELEQHFAGENENREREIEKLSSDREQLAATLQALKTQPSPLNLILEHKESLATNIKKFKLLIPSLMEHAKAVRKLLREKEAEVADLDIEISQLKEEKQRLSEVLDRQEQDAIDMEQMSADRDMLRKALAKASSDRVNADAERTDAQQLVSIAQAELMEILKLYNKSIETLQLDERITKLNLNDNLREAVIDKDVQGDILPRLMAQKEEYAAKAPKLQEEIHLLKERGDEIEERLMFLRHSLGMLEAKKSKLETDYQEKKSHNNELLRQRHEMVLEGGEKIKAERKRLHELMRCRLKEFKHLEDQMNEYKQMCKRYEERWTKNTELCNLAFEEHQRDCRSLLGGVRKYFEGRRAALMDEE